jgi:TatD DNase family protein
VTPEGYPPLPEPLPMPVVDTHCHLEHARNDAPALPPSDALALAGQVRVSRVVQVGCDVEAARWSVELANWHAKRDVGVVAAVGLHPTEAAAHAAGERALPLDEAFEVIAALAADPAVVAVGETGLDHYWTTDDAGRQAQEESFRRHIGLARTLDRTLVIHDRDAHDDIVRVLRDEGAPPRVVFHCFSGDAAMARLCAEQGWFCSFAGPLTFRNAAATREAAAAADPHLTLVETDAPYLTPHPHRGRPNASYLLPHTVRALAAAQGRDLSVTLSTLADATARAFPGVHA